MNVARADIRAVDVIKAVAEDGKIWKQRIRCVSISVVNSSQQTSLKTSQIIAKNVDIGEEVYCVPYVE